MITSGIQPRAKNMKKNQTKTNDNGLKSLENKWGKNVIAQGWTGVPNTLIERQQALGLSSLDVNILLILLKYWWDADSLLIHQRGLSVKWSVRRSPRYVGAWQALNARGLSSEPLTI